jgi:hypothetical protein
MLVPNMSVEEIRKEVLKDYPILQRKMNYHSLDIKKKLSTATLKQGYVQFFDYTSKYKNHWIYKIICYKKEYDIMAMLVYHNGKGHVGIEVADDNSIIYHTGHFFLRYNERRQLGLCNFNDIVKAYLNENFMYHLQMLDKLTPDIYTFFGRTQTGVIMGTINKKTSFAKINTFLTNESLNKNQLEQLNQLRAQMEKYKGTELEIP